MDTSIEWLRHLIEQRNAARLAENWMLAIQLNQRIRAVCGDMECGV